jgi:hypothetical protein
MVKRGTLSPGEAYNYAKAREDFLMDKARQSTGLFGLAAELLGGGAAGAGLANAGLTTGRILATNPGFLARTASSAADAAALSGIAGANEGNSLAERASNAGQGLLTGALTGGALPVVGAAVSPILSPFISGIVAKLAPEGYANRQVARAIVESGRPTADIGADLASAAAEGQPGYNLADALGNAGQRMLSTVARAPGEGRTAVVNALEARQAGQGRRVSNALAEGFQAPQTAAQTEAAMTAARDAAANTEYGAVRAASNPVDVVPAINNIDAVIGTQPGQQLQAANDSIETVLRGFRERLARVNPDDFEAVQRIRYDMADAAQSARQSGYGNRARLIGNAVRALDQGMEAASPGYAQANRNFAQASRDIEAVQAGRQAAMRGRSEDTIPAFVALRPQAQQAFRAGYADPLIEAAQSAAPGVNKARPLLNDAVQAESAAMAPGNALMQRRLAREQTMFETRTQALGGSRTADNLADAAEMGIDPSVVMHIMHGNFAGAARSLISAGAALTGNNAAVRSNVANLLLRNGVTPAQLDQLVAELTRTNAGVRGATSGVIATAPQLFPKRRNSHR